MGIYLPTVSVLIEESEIPSVILDSYHGTEHLLEKYWKSDCCYNCTTRGYRHIEEFRRLTEYFNLTVNDLYTGEAGFANPGQVEKLKFYFNEIESLVLSKSEDIVNIHLIKSEQQLRLALKDRFPIYKTEKYEKLHLESIQQLQQLDLNKIYQQAPLLKEISDFDLQDQFKEIYHPIIAVMYWLKTQIDIVNKAVETKQAIMHVVISPL